MCERPHGNPRCFCERHANVSKRSTKHETACVNANTHLEVEVLVCTDHNRPEEGRRRKDASLSVTARAPHDRHTRARVRPLTVKLGDDPQRVLQEGNHNQEPSHAREVRPDWSADGVEPVLGLAARPPQVFQLLLPVRPQEVGSHIDHRPPARVRPLAGRVASAALVAHVGRDRRPPEVVR